MVDRIASKRRRIMKEFVIRELSAVDRPAQEHARAVIMKRADDEDDIDKAGGGNPNHDEHGRFSSGPGGGGDGGGGKSNFLDLAEKIGLALRERRSEEDRLRAAGNSDAANAIYAENKNKARALLVASGLSPKEFDAKMRSMAGRGRRINVKMTNLFPDLNKLETYRVDDDEDFGKDHGDYSQASSLQTVEDDIEAMDFDEVVAADQSQESAKQVRNCVWSCWNALQRSFNTISGDDSLAPADKVGAMQESLAQFLDAVRAKCATVADAIEKSISAAPALAELLTATGSEGGTSMTDAEKRQLAELQKTVEDLTKRLEAATAKEPAKKAADLAAELEKTQAQIAELSKRDLRAIMANVDLTKRIEIPDCPELAELFAKAGMSDAEKAHCAGMDDKAKKAFMDMSPEDRKKVMTKAADADPVVYKSESTGEEFRKSDDPRLVKMARQVDESEKLAKSEARKREDAELAKRADDELSAFSEEIAKREEKIEVLRAIDKMDEAPRGALLKMLSVGGKAVSAAFETIGHKQGRSAVSSHAFDKRVSEVQARDKCSRSDAMSKARQEFPAEFTAAQGTADAN